MRQFIKTRLRRAAVAAPALRVPTGSEVFASATTSLTTSLESARRALSRGSTDATAIAAVRDFAAMRQSRSRKPG